VIDRHLVLVPEGQDVPLKTELPALGFDSLSALTLLEKNGMATAQDTEEFMGGPIP
jgi:hypothetical protein